MELQDLARKADGATLRAIFIESVWEDGDADYYFQNLIDRYLEANEDDRLVMDLTCSLMCGWAVDSLIKMAAQQKETEEAEQ